MSNMKTTNCTPKTSIKDIKSKTFILYRIANTDTDKKVVLEKIKLNVDENFKHSYNQIISNWTTDNKLHIGCGKLRNGQTVYGYNMSTVEF